MKKRILALLLMAALVFVLGGCDSSKYKEATELYTSGQYAEAAAIFSELGDYEDSADKVIECIYMNGETLFTAGDYSGAIAAYTAVGDYNDAPEKLAEAEYALMLETYRPVIDLLSATGWYFNGGSDTLLNLLNISQDNTTISQFQMTGNGATELAPKACSFHIDDVNITITCIDGSELTIPYILEGSKLTLGNGDYYSAEEVDAALQGYWKYNYSDYVIGMPLRGEYNYYIDNGAITYENAALGNNLAAGGYYYYGPHEGTYTIGADGYSAEGRTVDMSFNFNIIDGKVVLLHYDNICQPTTGFPGKDGYNFS